MKFNHQYTRSHQDGFTLVEIMIGLVIGMLATLVIVQVMSVFETQKRSTTGTADAQTSGGIALYNVGRELKLAGYPLMPTGFPSVADSPLECTSLNGAADTTNITPVLITNGVAAAGVSASDTITIRYGNSLTGGIPRTIGAAPVGRAISVGNNFGCQNDDVVMITNGAACAMTRLAPETETPAAVTGTTTVNLMSTEIVPAAAVAGADLSCIGTWNTITYAVVNGNLQRNGADSVAGIVNIQAQYGISTTVNDNQINAWVDATGIWAPTALALT
ncbi:MAG: prepilin-type N-terminal cleavage/methylation domain-containing protein, partial [Methylotenera sp.]